MSAAQVKYSVNALLLSPLRVRWQALRSLWRYHGCWRLQSIRSRMMAELLQELSETMPMVLLLAFVAAMMIFIALPATLREQSDSVLAALWPVWLASAAPMVCALLLAMLNAPALALHYAQLDFMRDGLADLDPLVRERRIVALALPQILAHAALCAVLCSLLLTFTLVFGVVAEMVLAVGDLRSVLDVLFASASPWLWLRSWVLAALLGAVCALCVVLFAWPGSLTSASAKDAHRIGVGAIIVCAVACVATGLALAWLGSMLGWNLAQA